MRRMFSKDICSNLDQKIYETTLKKLLLLSKFQPYLSFYTIFVTQHFTEYNCFFLQLVVYVRYKQKLFSIVSLSILRLERSMFFTYINILGAIMAKDRKQFCDFLKRNIPKINKKSDFIDMSWKMGLLRNICTQICVMFQKSKDIL